MLLTAGGDEAHERGSATLASAAQVSALVAALPGRFSTCYLIAGPAGGLVVDPGSALLLAGLAAAAERLGAAPSACLLTHPHFDHLAGLPALLARWPMPVLAGPRTLACLRGDEPSTVPPHGGLAHLAANWVRQGLPLPPLADLGVMNRLRRGQSLVATLSPSPGAAPRSGQGAAGLGTLADGQDLAGWPGWRVLLLAGHAVEDLCLYHAGAGLLIVGDLVANLRGGEPNRVLTEPRAYEASLARLRGLRLQALLPGHGPLVLTPERIAAALGAGAAA